MAEDTVTEEQLRCSGYPSPFSNWAVEPRAPSARGDAVLCGTGTAVWTVGTGRGVPRTERYGPSGPPGPLLPGYPPPSLPSSIIFFPGSMVTPLALLPVVVTPRPVGAAVTAPPLQAARLLAARPLQEQ